MVPKNRVHVLFFIHDLAPFGAQRVALDIVKGLDKRRFRVTVCPLLRELTLASEFGRCEAEVIPLGGRRFLDLPAWGRLAATLLRLRPDIIQTNLAELSLPVRVAAFFLPGNSTNLNIKFSYSLANSKNIFF